MGLLNPAKIVLDAVYRRNAYAVIIRKLLQGWVVVSNTPTNLAHYMPSQFRLSVISTKLARTLGMTPIIAERTLVAALKLPANTLLSFLFNHIRHIIGVGSKDKVVRIDAGRNIAGVHNAHIVRDRPLKKVVRNPMPHPYGAAIFDKFYGSITLSIFAVLPQPAAIFVNLVAGMESLDKVLSTHDKPSLCLPVMVSRKVGG